MKLIHINGVWELPATDPNATVCGICGRGWDDQHATAVTPTPAGRCPFEDEHDDMSSVEAIRFDRLCDELCAGCGTRHHPDHECQDDTEPPLTADELEDIEGLLYEYAGALDNVLYERYSPEGLEKKLRAINKLIGRLS